MDMSIKPMTEEEALESAGRILSVIADSPPERADKVLFADLQIVQVMIAYAAELRLRRG